MANLNIDTFIAATQFLHLSTGDKATKTFWVGYMVENGVSPKVANLVWSMVLASRRVQKGVVIDAEEIYLNIWVSELEVIRSILLQLQPDGGLTEPLVSAICKVTGIESGAIYGAFNTLAVENFIEQRKTVQPFQYIPRRWAAQSRRARAISS